MTIPKLTITKLTSNRRYERKNYIKCKNDLWQLTRELRRDYEQELARIAKSKPKAFSKYAKSRLKTKPQIPALSKPDGSKASTPKDKAGTLHAYFFSVFTVEDIQNIPETTPCVIEEVLQTIEITLTVVRKKLHDLNPNKSPGHDQRHPYFLKELADCICIPLSIFYNKSLKEGAHKSWTKAIITAIYKKGLKSETGNVMESIIRDTIVAHLMKHGILWNDQQGFVPERNCITQLLICIEDWTNMVENGESFDIIYTDFSKAFDSVAHQRLLLKLENVGIKGDLLYWIRTFLTRRTQCVNVNGITSSWIDVISGIPQGSVLGPLLFVICINDMPEKVKFNICKLFADDCKLYGPVNENDSNKMEIDLHNLEKWSKQWQLPFNAKKCKVMHVGSKNPNREYKLNDMFLDASDHEKDLGVIMDDKLKFRTQAARGCNKKS